ncbi:hypothetical protein DCC85_02775 [Paenibacillus sp. CAA11]|uniref:hypothetical protein n=1 Tax=Paenibacillus sp. CAA11 TaxID=1532905 RepID=UPI000D35DB3C|nr:hypothetical protein [Paenibacillus sp. CAA11]AWB43257.1 hypothetical protein DCC85_02775 [Paenibacillus sp. CAA11]
MQRLNPYKWWNVLAYLAMITVNVLAITIPLGGMSIGELSDKYHTLITPAGYAFMIWSLIYLLLAGFTVFQFRRATENRDSVRTIGPWFILSCIFNLSWILLWQYPYSEWSVAAMILLLLSLIIIYRKARNLPYPTPGETWFIRLPFSIYLGWISIATIVNVAAVLEKNHWDGWGLSDAKWAIIMLCVAAVLAVLVSFPYRDPIFPLVFVWAFIAIAAEQRDTKNVYLTAGSLAIILFLYALWMMFARARARD